MYEGFLEEDKKYVTEAILYWKKNNKKYYDLVKKVYGDTYDKLNVVAYNQLTKEERRLLSIIKDNLYSLVEKRKRKDKTLNQKLQQNENIIISQNQILIKDIFQNEIMQIGRYVHMQLKSQNRESQKNAIYIWNMVENLFEKPITDVRAFHRMIEMLNILQQSPVYLNPMDEKIVKIKI